jgi:cytochrome c oxidase subunit 2
MNPKRGTGRIQRRTHDVDIGRAGRLRYVASAVVVVVVLGAGLALAFGDFLGRPDADTSAATPVRMSMAGFTPQVISGKAGTDLRVELWTTDAAVHLEGGVHTLISDELGIHEELPAESRRTITIHMPTTPGDYDIYCDTCCGGKDSPTMHGKLRVTA